ncbi:MAG TPA: putative glycoside hydrolase [Allosphingosinicella sp.]
MRWRRARDLGWTGSQTFALPLGCFARAGVDMQRVSVPFTLATAGRLTLSVSDVRIASATVPQDRCAQP